MKTIIESVEGRKFEFIYKDIRSSTYPDCVEVIVTKDGEEVLSRLYIKKAELKRLGKSLD